MDNSCTLESFMNDVKDHKINIIHDDGVHRHIQMRRESSSCYYYNITTWDGFLCISGDMGCYVFSRLNDMFEFFRVDVNDWNYKNKINPSYWAEKLEAVNKTGGYEEFSYKAFCRNVDRYIEQHTDDGDWTEEQIKDLRDDIYDNISESDTAQELYDTMSDYKYYLDDAEDVVIKSRFSDYRYTEKKPRFEVTDWWEYMGSCNEYTYHYIWCCYAIVYAIAQYDLQVVSDESAI